MPYTSTHLSIWLDFSEKEKIEWEDKILFLIGTLLPDIRCNQLDRNETHYYSNSEEFLSWKFVENFINSEKILENWKINYLLYWYLLHLITDETFIEHNFVYVPWTYEHSLWNTWREINAKNDFYYALNIEEEFLNIKKYLVENSEINWLTNIYKNIKNLNKQINSNIDFVLEATNWKSNFLYEMLVWYEWLRDWNNIDNNIIEFKKHFTSSYKHRNLKRKVVEEFYKKIKLL